MRTCARDVIAALLLLVGGCATGGGDAARRDVEVLKAEVRQLQQDNAALARRVDSLQNQLDLTSAARQAKATAAREDAAAERAPVIPPDLAVVRVAPPAAASRSRTPPPVPTSVPIAEPDADRVEALSRRGRDLAAESEVELKQAREERGAKRARLLEQFVEHYPRHPEADNALVEAATVWAEAGLETQACEDADRVAHDYPAGDALPDALERLAWCEQHRGARQAERRLLERLVQEFPRSPAAHRAGPRLATLSGRTGATPDAPARSGP